MDDPLVFSSPAPKVADLVAEFKQCSPQRGVFNALSDSDNTRFARWDGQTEDGKKHSTDAVKAFPWEGSSDIRVLLADSLINEMKDTCTVAFWRSVLRAQAVGAEDVGLAGAAQKAVTWFIHNAQRQELRREVELSAQYLNHYGWTVLHPTWSRLVRVKLVKLELAAIAGDMPEFATLIASEELEAEAVAMFKAYADQYVTQQLSELEQDAPSLSQSEARRLVRQLRNTGTAKVPVPYVCDSRPSIIALKPYEEVFIHPDTTDIQRARVFVKYYFTEAELREKVLTEGWDADWVEQAAGLKGHFSIWAEGENLIDTSFAWWQGESPYIEVIYAYYPTVDDDNVSGIYCTVFHADIEQTPQGKPLAAKHGVLEYGHGQMPFVAGARELWCRRFTTSRGVPEIVNTWQREMKVQRDSIVDRTSFTTLPPILTPSIGQEVNYSFGPAVQVPVMAGRKPEFMEIPRWDGATIGVLERLDADVAVYFALISDKVLPARWQTRQQAMVNNFLGMWETAFKQELALVIQYLSPVEWQRITGAPPLPARDPNLYKFDLTMTFDVRELDVDHTMAKLDAISKFVLPEDVTGTIDRVKLTRLKLRALDPAYEEQLVSDDAAASQQIYNDVRNEIAQMALGNEPQYVENDPTAQSKLQFASQIVGANPLYQQMLQQNQRFQQLMEKFAKNLTFSVTQQQNKQVGRIGVQPENQLAGPRSGGG